MTTNTLPRLTEEPRDAPPMWTPEKTELLKRTICQGATDDELLLFMHACRRTGLDPFLGQIHGVKRYSKRENREVMAIQTGIDGYRLIAERTGRYAPGKKASYRYDREGKLVSATAYVRKQTQDGTWHDVEAEAMWDEYVATYQGKPNSMWAGKPHIMLAKCAEALALRRAFPADLSGIYADDEMQQADNQPPWPVPSRDITDEKFKQKTTTTKKKAADKPPLPRFITQMQQAHIWNVARDRAAQTGGQAEKLMQQLFSAHNIKSTAEITDNIFENLCDEVSRL